MSVDINCFASDTARGLRYRLYVVELGRFPGVDGRTAVYVGSTRKSADQRFREHLADGFTSARRVRRYGTRLLPELYRQLPTYRTRAAAELAEHTLACGLATDGYRVFGGSGRAMPRRRPAGQLMKRSD